VNQHSSIHKFLHKDIRPVISLTAIILSKHELIINPGLVIALPVSYHHSKNKQWQWFRVVSFYTSLYTSCTVNFLTAHELGIVLTSWVLQCRQNEAGLSTAFLLRNRARVCHWECLIYHSISSKCITRHIILSKFKNVLSTFLHVPCKRKGKKVKPECRLRLSVPKLQDRLFNCSLYQRVSIKMLWPAIPIIESTLSETTNV